MSGTHEGVAKIAREMGEGASDLVGKLLDASAREREAIETRIKEYEDGQKRKFAVSFTEFYEAVERIADRLDSRSLFIALNVFGIDYDDAKRMLENK